MSDTPDSRSLSHMDPETKIVHVRLEAWGRWARDIETRAWPERSVLGRLIEEGPGAGQAGRPAGYVHPDIAAVESAVVRLPPKEREVVREYYTRWAPPEVVARRVRMGRREFGRVLYRARVRVSGYLTALAEIEV